MLEIETERLTIRPFKPEDLDDYHARIYGDADAMRYIADGKIRTREQTASLMQRFDEHGEQYGFTVWAVDNRLTGELIGHCGLIHIQTTPDVEIAYAFGKSYWGQGFATEAARACLRYGFETAKLECIIAVAYIENLASQRVMQKIGMQHQGVTEKYYDARLMLYQIERAAYRADEAPYRVR